MGDDDPAGLAQLLEQMESEMGGSAAGASADGPSQDEVAEFLGKWSLNDDALNKLSKVTPSVQQAAIRDFNPKNPQPGVDLTGKFIMFVAMLERGHGMQEAPAAVEVPPSEEELAEFAGKWVLNDDAMSKMLKVSPSVQRSAIRDFNPKNPTPGVDLSGKFIMFVAMLERNAAGKSNSQKGYGKDAYGKGKGKDKGKGMGGFMGMGGFGGKGQGKWEQGMSSGWGNDGVIQEFCQFWSLNQDAVGKLYKLTPSVQTMVMNQFAPPPTNQDLSGKFIMFASSLEKAHAGGDKGGGGKGGFKGGCKGGCKGGSSSSSMGEFVMYWGLNQDAQQKLMKISPEVQQTVMSDFAPPYTGQDVSGKFIMFASSIEKGKGRGVKRPRTEDWAIGGDALAQQWGGGLW